MASEIAQIFVNISDIVIYSILKKLQYTLQIENKVKGCILDKCFIQVWPNLNKAHSFLFYAPTESVGQNSVSLFFF